MTTPSSASQDISLRRLSLPLDNQIAFISPNCLPRNLSKHQTSVVRHSLSFARTRHRQRNSTLLRAAISDSTSVEMTSTSSDEGSCLSNPEQQILYFCYGSNMMREKLKNRNSPSSPPIAFTKVWTARLPDWQLCFNLAGAPPQEPCMGSIQEKQGDEVYGLVYQLASEDCWQALSTSEGITEHHGPSDSYHVVTLEVECFDTKNPSEVKKVLAKTFVTNPKFCLSDRLQTLVLPSQRYMNLLIQGARQEELPPQYIQRLEARRVARRWEKSFLLSLMTLTIPLTFLVRRKNMSLLSYPISKFGIMLYAMHEKLAVYSNGNSLSRNVGLLLCRTGLLILYGVYVIPSVLCLVLSPKGRYFYKAIFTKRAQREQEAQQMQSDRHMPTTGAS